MPLADPHSQPLPGEIAATVSQGSVHCRSHLALVQPEVTNGGSSVRVAAVAADFAAALLAKRFAAPGASGLPDLVAEAAAAGATRSEVLNHTFKHTTVTLQAQDAGNSLNVVGSLPDCQNSENPTCQS